MPKLEPNYLNEKSLKLLQKSKIFSVNDFLQAEFQKKVIASKLNEEEIISAVHKLISNYSAKPTDGLNLYQFLLRKTNIIHTYIQGLDELLNGGLLTGTIIEICGLSGSGKTQICLTIAINIAARSKSHVTYIDTKRDFRAKRLLQILRHSKSTEDFDNVLEKINVICVDDIYNLITTLHGIKNCSLPNKKLGQIIILDSLPSLFFPFIGLTNNEGISLLNHIASTLKEIASDQHMAIVFTNLGSKYDGNLDNLFINKLEDTKNDSDEDHDCKPSLGKYWLHVPNTRLIISKLNTVTSERMLTIKKSDYIKIGNNCIVNVFEGGVK